MALTIGNRADGAGLAPGNPVFIDIVPITFDVSYTTGGLAVGTLLEDEIGKGRTILAMWQNNVVGTTKVFARYDRTADKIVAYDWAGSEISNATDLLDVVLEMVILSK